MIKQDFILKNIYKSENEANRKQMLTLALAKLICKLESNSDVVYEIKRQSYFQT